MAIRDMYLRALVFSLAALTAGEAAAGDLYVSLSGDDSVSYAQNSASRPWRTIGRAAWGSTTRSAPRADEAAKAGDTVHVSAGDYAFGGTVRSRWGVVYNPVNSGTAAAPIRFVATGLVRLSAPAAAAPVIGSSERDYIIWTFKDAGRWIVDEAVIAITPDTGPVVFHDGRGGGIEGCEIDGNGAPPYNDNHPGARFEAYDDGFIRDCYIHDVRHVRGNHNGAGVMAYVSQRLVVERNRIERVDSGVFIKGAYAGDPQVGVIVRYNHGIDCGECIIDQDGTESRIYGNVLLRSETGIHALSRGPAAFQHPVRSIYANNTILDMSLACIYLTGGAFDGVRVIGNIAGGCPAQFYVQAAEMPPAAAIDVQHGVAYDAGPFVEDSTGRRSLRQLKETGHGTRTPVTATSDPKFVNPKAGDYRLTPDSPARRQSIDVLDLDGDGDTSEIIPAGAYVTGEELIGTSPGAGAGPGGRPPAPVAEGESGR